MKISKFFIIFLFSLLYIPFIRGNFKKSLKYHRVSFYKRLIFHISFINLESLNVSLSFLRMKIMKK